VAERRRQAVGKTTLQLIQSIRWVGPFASKAVDTLLVGRSGTITRRRHKNVICGGTDEVVTA